MQQKNYLPRNFVHEDFTINCFPLILYLRSITLQFTFLIYFRAFSLLAQLLHPVRFSISAQVAQGHYESMRGALILTCSFLHIL